jgi:hypothetical protein
MDCPFDPEPRSLFILSHPNHELPVMGLVRHLKPRIIYLTDGGGAHRVAQTVDGLSKTEATPIFLDRKERSLYQALLDQDEDFFIKLAQDVVSACPDAPDRIFCDAVEFYNPVHDISLPVAMKVADGFPRRAPIFEIPLIYQKEIPDAYEIQRAPPALRGREIRWKLPHAERLIKTTAWHMTYTILSSTMGPAVPNVDECAATESVFVAGSPLRRPEKGQFMRYERRGALLMETGEVERVITHDDHYLACINPLLEVSSD